MKKIGGGDWGYGTLHFEMGIKERVKMMDGAWRLAIIVV